MSSAELLEMDKESLPQGEFHIVNSEPTWNYFIQWARAYYDRYKYVTFDKPRLGPDRSIDQNSLLHLWLTEYAAHLLNKDKKKILAGELAGMKRVSMACFVMRRTNRKYYEY